MSATISHHSPEMRPRVFRDPVHVNVEFPRSTDWGKLGLALIDTPEVQRLRRIRQLGLAGLVYHGAEHSRFNHTLGVAHLAMRLYSAAKRNSGKQIDQKEIASVVASAILHDTGHPPFSHAVEKELGVRHEKATVAIVLGSTEANRVLREYGGEEFVQSVAGHIDGSLDAATVDIINSQLDADRLDYVLRDGYYAGVPNAQYDLERIVQMIQWDVDSICFDERAQFAIEGYFLARYHLYLQLYYHKTVRAAEVVLRALLRRAKHVATSGSSLGPISSHLDHLCRSGSIADSIAISDADMWSAFGVWTEAADPILQDLSRRLINRYLFRTIDISAQLLPRFYEQWLPNIRSLAASRGLDPNYYVLPDTASDTPYKIADLSNTTSVRLVKADGKVHTLEAVSGIIKSLQEEAYQRVRCCFPLELRNDVMRIVEQ